MSEEEVKETEDQEAQTNDVASDSAPPEPKTRENIHEMKLKSELSRIQKEYEDLQNQMKQKDIKEMKAKEDWQNLASQYEQEANEYKERYTQLQKNLIYDKKVSDLKTKALQYNLRKEALDDLDMLDLSDIQVETTSTGRINVLGTDDVLKRLKVSKPHWFQSQKTNFNTQTPTATNQGKITFKDLKEAETKAKASGDYSDYKEKLLSFKKQQQK